MLTRLGQITFDVLQVRGGGFYPSALDKSSRTKQAVNIALAEMYVQGVSIRLVIEVLQRLVGPDLELYHMKVSRAAANLDEGLRNWRERPLGIVPYLYLDARYEKIRYDGRIVDCAVLIAAGVEPSGKRRVLGCTVATSEAEINWRRFLESLVARGMIGTRLIISDDHAGLKAARKAVLPAVPWQRCQVHLQQNAAHLVTRQEDRKEVAKTIRVISNASDKAEAHRLLKTSIQMWQTKHPKLAA